MIEVEIDYEPESDRPIERDWVDIEGLERLKRNAREYGGKVRVIGEVSWQRQLAAMENNPE